MVYESRFYPLELLCGDGCVFVEVFLVDIEAFAECRKCAYKYFITCCKCVKIRNLAFENSGRKCVKILQILFVIQEFLLSLQPNN